MTNNFFKQSACVALLSAATLAAPSLAPAQSLAEEESRGFAIGLGVYGVTSPYEEAKDEVEVGLFPYFSYQSTWLSVDPNGAAVRVFGWEGGKIEVLAGPRWLLADPENSRLHSDLEREIGVDAGVRASAQFGRIATELEYRGDISDTSKGHEVSLAAATDFQLPAAITLGVKAGARWRSGDLGTYLYGVYEKEARHDRPAYDVGDTITPFIGAIASYPLTRKTTLSLGVEAEFFPNAVKDSPIVAKDGTVSSFLTLFYHF